MSYPIKPDPPVFFPCHDEPIALSHSAENVSRLLDKILAERVARGGNVQVIDCRPIGIKDAAKEGVDGSR